MVRPLERQGRFRNIFEKRCQGEEKRELGLSNAPHRKPVVLVVVVLGVHIRRIEVQVVPVVGIVYRGGPIVPVGTNIRGTAISTIPVPGVREASWDMTTSSEPFAFRRTRQSTTKIADDRSN